MAHKSDLILPNFLVIGAMRSGTTWLHNILNTHPEICLPTKRKEVNYFDHFFDRGIEWYSRFFSAASKHSYKAIGEITPNYLSAEPVPQRIASTLPEVKLILILRNPVDRAFSHYGFMMKSYGIDQDFQTYFRETPEVFYKGLYGHHIKRYLNYFPREQFLILKFEDFRSSPSQISKKISEFLDVSPNKFDEQVFAQKFNSSSLPRFPSIRSNLTKFRDNLRKHDLDFAWNLAKASKLDFIFDKKAVFEKPDFQVRSSILKQYESDIELLTKLTEIDFSAWSKV